MRPSLALLIDGDQVPADGIAALLDRLEKDWTVDERICVRNWRSTRDQQAWRTIAAELGIRLIQRDPARVGKNASDIELAVIIVDLLHSGRRAFCLVSGDTDFTPVVERLRRASAHIEVVAPKELLSGRTSAPARGRGRSRGTPRPGSPPAGRTSAPASRPAAKPAPRTATRAKTPPASGPTQDQLAFAKAIRRVITDLRGKGEHDRGWVSVNRVGTVLAERKERRENYGFAKSRPLSTILADLAFKVEQIETGQYRVTID